jgi:hypothetical protein
VPPEGGVVVVAVDVDVDVLDPVVVEVVLPVVVLVDVDVVDVVVVEVLVEPVAGGQRLASRIAVAMAQPGFEAPPWLSYAPISPGLVRATQLKSLSGVDPCAVSRRPVRPCDTPCRGHAVERSPAVPLFSVSPAVVVADNAMLVMDEAVPTTALLANVFAASVAASTIDPTAPSQRNALFATTMLLIVVPVCARKQARLADGVPDKRMTVFPTTRWFRHWDPGITWLAAI